MLSINQPHKIDIDKQVNDKGRPEGLAAVGHIAEEDTGKQTADGLYLRLAYMHQHKRNHLDEDAAFFEFLL